MEAFPGRPGFDQRRRRHRLHTELETYVAAEKPTPKLRRNRRSSSQLELFVEVERPRLSKSGATETAEIRKGSIAR